MVKIFSIFYGTSWTHCTSSHFIIVTHRSTARLLPQHTRGQQYKSSVFCSPRTDRCYATHAKHILAYAVTSHNTREAVFSAVVHAEYL
jgi:hypothetical protein